MAKTKHIAELGDHSGKVEYQGKRYELTVKDKVSDKDGIIESHLDYVPLDRPKGAKSRGNFATGLRYCLGKCKCPGRPCDKRKKD